MPIKPKPVESHNFEPMPAGTYPARLYSLIHIGTIPFDWQGESKMIDKVRLTFEFPTETKVFKEENGEQPYVLSLEFTLSMHEKSKLRPFLEGWGGRRLTDQEASDLDLEEWVGKEGLANIVHSEGKNGNIYANIQSVSSLPKGLTCPPQVNETFILNYEDKWDEGKFQNLPDFLRDKMMESTEYQVKLTQAQIKDRKAGETPDGEIDLKDLPF